MEKIPKFNKRRAFNKSVGPEKKSKTIKRRTYVYFDQVQYTAVNLLTYQTDTTKSLKLPLKYLSINS